LEKTKTSKSSNASREGESRWHEIASAARAKLDRSPNSRRPQDLDDIEKLYGVKADTLRRFIAAASFVDRLYQLERNDPRFRRFGHGIARALARAPVASIEIIARWSTYDEEGAYQAASELAQGYGSVRSLRAKEIDARSRSGKIAGGRAGDIAVRELISPMIRAVIEHDGASLCREDMPSGFDPKGLDLLFVSASDPKQRVAVAIFGPYQDERLYLYRKDEFLLKILGLSRAYGTVAGIVPGPERQAEFEEWLNHFADPRITFHYLDLKAWGLHSPRPIHLNK
jgi:hypothetical protein